MNILFAIGGLELGGAQTFLLRLASALKKQEHKVWIYNTHPKRFDSEILSFNTTNIKIINAYYDNIELKLSRYPILVKIFHRLFKKYKFDSFFLKKFIKKNKITVINTHLYLADAYISKLNIPQNIKLVSSWHGCYNLLWEDFVAKGKEKELKKEVQKIFKNIDNIVIIAEKHREAYINLGLETPYSKIYNGFTLPDKIIPANFPKKDNFVFGIVARGDATKGWAEAIEAFKRVKRKTQKKIKLILIGWSDFLADLKNQNNDPDIIFAGNTNNPLGWIHHFDVGMLPTYYPAESLPNTIIEYLAMGKPVIATDWAEIPNMIGSIKGKGKAGILIPLNNKKPDIEALTKAMINLIENKNFYRQLTENTKFAFEKFSMQRCAEKYLKVF